MHPGDLLTAYSQLDFHTSLLLLFTAFLGCLLLLAAAGRLWHGRFIMAGFTGSLGLALLGGTVITALTALNIITYHRLTYEAPIATISFMQLGQDHYQATLVHARDNRRISHELRGNEWQLDARVLRWEPVLQVLGFNALYRLERLTGRYRNIEDEVRQPRTVYALSHEQGLDIWSLAHDYHHWLPWLDAYYGSATYLPMEEGARFAVSINQYGIIARPDNAQAEDVLSNWQ